MADSTEAKMSGGQAPREAGLRLDQPTDAVKMKNLAESTTNPEASTADAKDSDDSPPKRETDTSSAAALLTSQAGTSTAMTEAEPEEAQSRSDKGKDRAARPPSPPAKNDEDDMAIGASTDDVARHTPKGDSPVCVITLLISSGKRHPYRIDEKYLAKRNVAVPGVTEDGKMDPFSISVYTLKELILREWRDEWEARPASPSSIRLIHFGKLLNDKDQLKQYKFSTEASNVVHMSVRPTDMGEDEEPKSTNKSARDTGRDDASRCCVIL